MDTKNSLIFHRLPAVLSRVGLGRATLWNMIRVGNFPKPIQLSQRTVAWPSTTIDEWMNEKMSQSRALEGK